MCVCVCVRADVCLRMRGRGRMLGCQDAWVLGGLFRVRVILNASVKDFQDFKNAFTPSVSYSLISFWNCRDHTCWVWKHHRVPSTGTPSQSSLFCHPLNSLTPRRDNLCYNIFYPNLTHCDGATIHRILLLHAVQ